MNQIECPVTWW